MDMIISLICASCIVHEFYLTRKYVFLPWRRQQQQNFAQPLSSLSSSSKLKNRIANNKYVSQFYYLQLNSPLVSDIEKKLHVEFVLENDVICVKSSYFVWPNSFYLFFHFLCV